MSRTEGYDRAAQAPDPDQLPPAQRARRDRIVRAAVELLDDREYESVQMRDVAEHAEVALGTLYRYFSSKEHLYGAALVAGAADYGVRRRPAPAGASDQVRLLTLLRRAVRAFERSPQLFRALMVVETSTDHNAGALIEVFSTNNRAALAEALADLDPQTADAIVTVAHCVLSTRLRTWAMGRCTIRDVDHSLQDTVALIFGDPPVAAVPS
jgi:AcrR family transcriptional regulator